MLEVVKRLKNVFSDQVWHSGAESGLSVLATNLTVSNTPRDSAQYTGALELKLRSDRVQIREIRFEGSSFNLAAQVVDKAVIASASGCSLKYY